MIKVVVPVVQKVSCIMVRVMQIDGFKIGIKGDGMHNAIWEIVIYLQLVMLVVRVLCQQMIQNELVVL
jgi:hypothetical protein